MGARNFATPLRASSPLGGSLRPSNTERVQPMSSPFARELHAAASGGADKALDYLLDLYRRKALMAEFKERPLELIANVAMLLTALLYVAKNRQGKTPDDLFSSMDYGPRGVDTFGAGIAELAGYMGGEDDETPVGGFWDDVLLKWVIERLIGMLRELIAESEL